MQREVSRKLYAQLPELSQLLDRTLARAPKDEYGPPPASLWHRLVVRHPFPAARSWAFLLGSTISCTLPGWSPASLLTGRFLDKTPAMAVYLTDLRRAS